MDTVTVYNEFIYSLAEQEALAAVKKELLARRNARELTGCEAARLLVNFDLFTKETSEELHLAIMMQAERNGRVRRYIDYLLNTMAEYLPKREQLLTIMQNYKAQSSIAIYQTYCAWKELYLKLQRAEVTCRDLAALDLACELCEGFDSYDQLTALLAAFDNHEEICQRVNKFLDAPLTVTAQEKAKTLAREFLDSLKVIKNLNYPLYYESLSQFVTTTHGQASRGLSLLLSAERLYRLEEATGARTRTAMTANLPDDLQKSPKTSWKWWGIGAGTVLLLLGGGLLLTGKKEPPVAVPTVVTGAQPAEVDVPSGEAPAPAAPPAVKERDAERWARVFTTSSPGVKSCAAGPLISANCPEASRGYLAKGSKIYFVQEEDSGWCQVEDEGGQTWWVFSGFVKGAEKHRKWLPLTTDREQRVFSDKKLTKIAGQLKPDGSFCGKSAGTSLLQVASPTGVMGYVLKSRVNYSDR